MVLPALINSVKEVIREYHMIEQGDKILVGVSGGADSMCLLKVMMMIKDEYDAKIYVIHINHQLRGIDSDADEEYVKEFCKEAGIECSVEYADVLSAVDDMGWSVEEAGRNLRYTLFYETMKKYRCNKIAVAHHQEDVAETVLFNMFRGTGLRGMCGIPVVRGCIIRPLIHTSRNEIEEFLAGNNISWRTDKSNLSDGYTRNKIRNRILSYAKSEINTSASSNIARLSIQMSEVYDYICLKSNEAYNEAVTKAYDAYIINIDIIIELHSVIRKEVLLKVLEKCYGGRRNIESLHVMDIEKLLTRQSGKQVILPSGFMARREFNKIIISSKYLTEKEKGYKNERNKIDDSIEEENVNEEIKKVKNVNEKNIKEEDIKIPGLYELPWLQKTLRLDIINYNKSVIIPKNSYTKWFDYDKIGNAVKLRIRKESDSIQINKSGGHKSIKALYIDNKVPISLRDNILLLVFESSVLWVPGIRASEGYHIDDGTKRILTAEIV